jgi:hypothetical protein
MKLYIAQIPLSEPIVLAGDHTRKVETVCQNPPRTHLRTFPITIGKSSDRTQDMAERTLAWIPEAQGSWAVPLRHERITSWDSPISQAVQQLSSVSSHLPSRALSLWDSEYGCAPFVNQTAFLPVVDTPLAEAEGILNSATDLKMFCPHGNT